MAIRRGDCGATAETVRGARAFLNTEDTESAEKIGSREPGVARLDPGEHEKE
jgi:hypothetical protein